MTTPPTEQSQDEFNQMAINAGFVDSPTTIAHRDKIEQALRTISDEGKSDAGMSADGFDFWIKLNGVEYFMRVKESRISENEDKSICSSETAESENRQHEANQPTPQGECNCTDGAYSHCEVCSPSFAPGWIQRQLEQARGSANKPTPADGVDESVIANLIHDAIHEASFADHTDTRSTGQTVIDRIRPYLRTALPVEPVSLIRCAMALQGNERIKLGSDLQAIAKVVLDAAGVAYAE